VPETALPIQTGASNESVRLSSSALFLIFFPFSFFVPRSSYRLVVSFFISSSREVLLSSGMSSEKNITEVVAEKPAPSKEMLYNTPQKSQSHCRYIYESGEQCLMDDEIEYHGAVYTVMAGKGGKPANPGIKLKEIRSSPRIKSVKFIRRGQGFAVPLEDVPSSENIVAQGEKSGETENSISNAVPFPAKNEPASLKSALTTRTRDPGRVDVWLTLLQEWEITSVQELKEVQDDDFRALLNHVDFSKKTNLKAALRHLRTY
jgi:hypothetical protein